jgi:hypothetical protein
MSEKCRNRTHAPQDTSLFDNFVGTLLKLQGHFEAEPRFLTQSVPIVSLSCNGTTELRE